MITLMFTLYFLLFFCALFLLQLIGWKSAPNTVASPTLWAAGQTESQNKPFIHWSFLVRLFYLNKRKAATTKGLRQ